MCRLVASLACVIGNDGVRSRDEKSNGKSSHRRTQGKAKTGMVNKSEPSLDASLQSATEPMADTVVVGQREKGSLFAPLRTPQTPA